MGVVTDLKRALEPIHPLLTFSWDAGMLDIEAVVYEPVNHEPTETFKLTPTYARTLMETVTRFSIDGDGVEYEDFVKLLDQLDAGTAPEAPRAQPLTCSFTDAVDFMLTARDAGDFEVTIDGATWLVKGR